MDGDYLLNPRPDGVVYHKPQGQMKGLAEGQRTLPDKNSTTESRLVGHAKGELLTHGAD